MKQFFLLLLFSALIFSSCVKQDEANIKYDKTSGSITINVKAKKPYSYTIKCGDLNLKADTTSGTIKENIYSLLKSEKDSHLDIAYQCATKGDVKVSVVVEELLDTTVSYSLPLYQEVEGQGTISGNVACLSRSNSAPTAAQDIRKWLFRRNEHLDDAIISKIESYYKTLEKSVYDEYRTNDAIPFVKAINGVQYQVSSNMKADHYALIAATSQQTINAYIEQKIGDKFAGMASNLGSLKCKCSDKTGYYCLTLIGINDDWTYQTQPLGLAAIDKEAPVRGLNIDRAPSFIDFKNNVRVFLPKGTPNIHGGALAYIDNWDGNGLWCNITFVVESYGDVKSVTIERTHELCYYSKYLGYDDGVRPTKKTISMKEVGSHYVFHMKMHFEDGNNFIPIRVEDYHGNVSTGKIIQNARFVRNNAPSINIDNNVNIDNH